MRSPKIKLLLAYIILLAAMYLLSACSQSKKLQKAKDTMLDNPAELAKLCSERFPAKETTIYLHGEIVRDTMYEFQELYVPVECPPSDKDTIIQWKVKNIRETVKETKVDTVSKVTVDKAKEFYLESQVEKAQKELANESKKLKNRTKIMWILVAVCLLQTAWITRKLWL